MRRLRPVAIEGRLVEPRLAGELRLGELHLALELRGGVDGIGPGCIEPGLGLGHARGGGVDLAPDTRDRALLGRELALGRVQRQPVVAVVHPGDHVARLDGLVVHNLDRGDIALHLRRQDGDVALHVGVVGRDQEASVGPPIVAEMPAIGRNPSQQDAEQQAADPALPAASGWRHGWRCDLHGRHRAHRCRRRRAVGPRQRFGASHRHRCRLIRAPCRSSSSAMSKRSCS